MSEAATDISCGLINTAISKIPFIRQAIFSNILFNVRFFSKTTKLLNLK